MTGAPVILIVGAGPTGLTAALELARHGFIADVIDRQDGPSELSKAVGIMPASMQHLAPSGAAAALRRAAVIADNVIIHQGATEVARLRLDLLDDPDMRLLCLAQDRTENILRDALERYGGKVQFGTELSDIGVGDDRVTVTVNQQQRSYDYVIAADGVTSTVRNRLGLRFDGIDLADDWSIADVDVDDWPDPRAFKAFFLPLGNAVIVVPLEDNRFRVIGNSQDALAMLPVPMKVRNLRRSGIFRISVRQVEKYNVGRVFLAGDAAHCHSPVGGRGMNLGIADAADLAARFANGGLEGYHTARHRAGQHVLKLSERGRRVVMSNSPFQRNMLARGIRFASHHPTLNARAVRGILTG